MVLNKTRKAKQQNDLKKTGDGHIKYYSVDVKDRVLHLQSDLQHRGKENNAVKIQNALFMPLEETS